MGGKTGGINRPQSSGQAGTARASSPWHAVAIKPKGTCCDAVQARRNARFLSAEAPRLPLADCSTSDTCTCVYKHHEDRRREPRRHDEKDGALPRNSKVEQERRSTRDRRKTD